MRPGVVVFVAASAAGLGIGAGWLARGNAPVAVHVVQAPPHTAPKPSERPAPSASFPEYPKPALVAPVEERTPTTVAKAGSPLSGELPPLPKGSVSPLSGPLPGPLPGAGPVVPDVSPASSAADLNADEALVRRTALQMGAEILSADDAKDSSGKVGRNLVAELPSAAREPLRAALRRALGDRAILSDGGIVPGNGPDAKKADDALAALKKRRALARVDYLPGAPVLRDLDEAILKQERSAAETRQRGARTRLIVFLHPVLGG